MNQIYTVIGISATYFCVFLWGVFTGKKMYKRFLRSIGKDALGNDDKEAGK